MEPGLFFPRREWHGCERPATPTDYPKACQECGLWKAAKSWGIQPEFDSRPGMEGRPWVLIIGQSPGADEDRADKVFANMRHSDRYWGAGAFLRPQLEKVPFRWVLTDSTACYAGKAPDGRGDKKPTEKQARLCSENRIPELIHLLKPKVVLCLGAMAMKAVLGKTGPKSIRATGGTPWRIPGTETFALVAEHPSLHRPADPQNPKDLTPAYQQMFAKAWRVLTDGVTRVNVEFRPLSSVREAVEWARNVTPDFWVDIEDAHHKKDPEARSIWHPGARILSMSVTDDNGETAVLLPPALLDPRVLDALFRGRSPEGHNVKYEIQGLTAMAKFEILPIVKRIPASPEYPRSSWGLPDIHDTLVKIVLPNQGKAGNSLKTIVQQEWGAEDWSQPIWEAIDEANKQIAGVRRWFRSLETRRRKREQKLTERRYWEAVRDSVGEAKAQRKVERKLASFERWLEKECEKHPQDFADLMPVPRPLGSANFGDVPLNLLLPYNAQDTYWPRRISKELVPRRAQEGLAYSQTAYDLVRRTIEICCRVEANGLPVDHDRLAELDAQLEREILASKLALLREKTVRAAVLRTNVMQKHLEAGKPVTGDVLVQALNPQAVSMRNELAREYGILEQLPLTKKGNPSVNKEVLRILAGEGRKWDQLSEGEKVWFVFKQVREAQDLRSKFLEELKAYTVGGRVRTDFRVIRVEGISRDAGSEVGGGAVTGRLSSRTPNLQNLKKDWRLRRLFVAPRGWRFVEADYDRIEPVVLCEVADVAGWRVIFERGLDLYMVIANDVYKLGVDLEGPGEVVQKRLKQAMLPGMRDGIKVRLLAIMYDESARSFAAKAGVSVQEVEAFFRDFYRAYPEIWEYKQRIKRQVAAGEYITTPFGRRRLFELPRPGKDHDRELGRLNRQALNVPIQSTASDITCWKGWELLRRLETDSSWAGDYELVNLVHDSVWSLVREERLLEFSRLKLQVLEDMSTLPFPFRVPLRTTLKYGLTLSTEKDPETKKPVLEAMHEFERRELVPVAA